MDFPAAEWYADPIRPSHVQLFRQRAVLFEGRTQFQQVRIVDTEPMGRLLELDGHIQSAQADEFVYHEALVHPALVLHNAPHRVLIAGGGEGATLREVLRHRQVESVVMVDIDDELVQLCRQYLPEWSAGAFDDPRAQLVSGDAKAYVEQRETQYDVIIIDITDPSDGGPSLPLFTKPFYQLLLRRLSPEGLLVTQAGPAALQQAEVFTAIAKTLEAAGATTIPYRANVASFGGDWGFVLAGRAAPCLTAQQLDAALATRLSHMLRFFDGITWQGMSALPKWLRAELAAEQRVITPETPIFLETR